MTKPNMILIMDGYGLNPRTLGNAIAQAYKPSLDRIMSVYPHTQLAASGEPVGLPDGQMGNSEVGHLNIGGGRIVYQDLSLITKAVKDGSFFKNPALLDAMEHVKKNNSTLHISGLLSDGGVHSHIDHLFALLDMAKKEGVQKIAVHCYLDGRDVPPRCALTYLKQLSDKLDDLKIGRIATISGRYYAMDRDTRWEREQLAYDAMTLGKGRTASSYEEAIQKAYDNEENDEFVVPTVIPDADGKTSVVSDGDSMIMYNFRPDRARQITRCFVDPDFDGFKREKTVSDLCYVCMTQYDASMPNVELAFPPEHYKNTLGEYISSLGLKQLRIAETEKYAHVTFFFNGGVEEPNQGEDRILIPSPKVATYDLQPEMSAPEITERVLREIDRDLYDVIILNFANADMVGHTGDMGAAVKAIETLDKCVPQIEKAVLAKDGQILLTADHGNADVMQDENGYTVTSHSLNPVPLVHIANHPKRLKDGGKLADIAPTLLKLMGLPIPEEMTGNVLAEE
ncbi:2,3-bisphosphoglycerate-independent phosphoglycerate mutase [Eubacterium sp. F2]|uniref:2,3-bisphosphoglycerate-independent phosphoglycerate mutase n=1 Tax=Eubacterium sp. F2 TaxID=3381348 RepID=UPI00390819C7